MYSQVNFWFILMKFDSEEFIVRNQNNLISCENLIYDEKIVVIMNKYYHNKT